MKLYFQDYFDYLRQNLPQAVTHARATFLDSQKPKSKTPVSRVFARLALDSRIPVPFDATLIPALVADTNQFLCKEKHPTNPAYANKDDTAYTNELAQQPTFQKLVNDITVVACEELLTEQGEIKPFIGKFFGLPSPTPRHITEAFIRSYVTSIIIPTIQRAWLDNKSFHPDLLQLVDGNDFVPSLFKKIIERNANSASLYDMRLSDALTAILKDEATLASIINSNPTELLTTIQYCIANAPVAQQLSAVASFYTGFTQFASAFTSTPLPAVTKILPPQITEAYLAHANQTIAETFDSELFHLGRTTCHFMAQNLDPLLSNTITANMKDFANYGSPWLHHFDHKHYLNYLTAPLPNNSRLFTGDSVAVMVDYFHDHIMMKTDYASDFSANSGIEKFATKIILLAYSQTLNSHGYVKAELVQQLKLQNSDNDRKQLVGIFLRNLLTTVLQSWMTDDKLQTEFNAKNVDALYLDNVVSHLEAVLANGLSKETLSDLGGFPLFGNKHFAKKFQLKLPEFSTKNTPLTRAVDETRIKLKLADTAKQSFENFIEEQELDMLMYSSTVAQIKFSARDFTKSFEPMRDFTAISEALSLDEHNQETLKNTLLELQQEEEHIKETYQHFSTHCIDMPLANLHDQLNKLKTAKATHLANIRLAQQRADDIRNNLESVHTKVRAVNLFRFNHDMEKFTFKLASVSKLKIVDAGNQGRIFLARKRIFPKALCPGFSLDTERDILKAAHTALDANVAPIQKIREELKICSLAEFIKNDAASLYAKVAPFQQAIIHNSEVITQSHIRIVYASGIVKTAYNESKAKLTRIYALLEMVLDNNQFWQDRIGFCAGGERFFTESKVLRIPKRAAAMMIVKNIIKADFATLDPDLKIKRLIEAFNMTPAGWSLRRSQETAEFYAIIKLLINAATSDTEADCNIYDLKKLDVIERKLMAFFQTCELRYRMLSECLSKFKPSDTSTSPSAAKDICLQIAPAPKQLSPALTRAVEPRARIKF